MSDPVILWGTTADGESLPVQVDATGRLVAEGLAGAEGPPGPPGPEGPEGPQGEPGLIQWPPNPQEGFVLTWVAGQPQWRKPAAQVQEIWSYYLTSGTGKWNPGSGPEKAFDGEAGTYAYVEGDGPAIFAPPRVQIMTLRFSTAENGQLPGYTYRVTLDNIQQDFPDGGNQNTWFNVNRLAGAVMGEDNPLMFQTVRPDGTLVNGNLSRLELNGSVLVDDPGNFRRIYRQS